MLDLVRLGAVSFTKGCYTGQEIVARTEHLGQVKRRLAHFRLDADDAQPLDPMLSAGREVGEVVNAAGGHVLAVVGLEWHDATLTVNGHTARPVPDV
jgi:folate-binding Fe-S cluster repair protein YgfZ